MTASDERLDRLVDLVVELASGDLDVRGVPSPARDTIDAVTTGFNLMADELQQMYADLESRVAERTAELSAVHLELERLALSDALTGLANRAMLAQRLDAAIAAADPDHQPPSVVLLDLDDFKAINDSLGHATGDEVLRVIAGRLHSVVRETDTVARLGGDEFAVVLPAASREQAVGIAERALTVLGTPIALPDRELSLRASIGVRLGGPDLSAEELLRDADTAMYQAKGLGKGNVAVFEAEMHAESAFRMRVGSDLASALATGDITVHYQPIVALADRSVIGAEALLRWQHPELGMLDPRVVVDIAERSGRIVDLDEWVLAEAMGAVRRWSPELRDRSFAVHVNLSALHLRRDGLLATVSRILAAVGVPASRLALEVSESALMKGSERGLAELEQLRAAGVRMHLDDFGTGYSSIAQLRRLPLDAVKVDRSLVGAVSTTQGDRGFLAAVLALIEAVGLRTIVKGVRTAEQAAILADMGVAFGQGYHFGRAVPESAFGALLRLGVGSGSDEKVVSP